MRPNDLEKKIEQYYKISKETSGIFDLGDAKTKRAYIDELFKNTIGNEICEIVEKQCFNHQDLKLLDMGCGLGGVILTCEKNDVEAIGIDIDKDAINIARERVKKPENILEANGENLPFKDNSFDIVTSTCTIEHVNNSQKYLSEAYRVLKNNGLFIIYAPNYLFPWEGHYKLFWLPYIFPYTKSIFKLYLAVRGKRIDFVDKINLKITPGHLITSLKKIGFKDIKNISIGRFIKRMENPSQIANPGIEKTVDKFKKNKILKVILKIFMLSLKSTRLYHPIIITAEKND
jgi:ubiquinone/menaquinone biosynthesis C-methylase UbiE